MHGFSLSMFDLPNIDQSLLPTPTPEFEEIQISDLYENANHEQRNIIDEILSVVHKNDNSVSNTFFIDGPAGTGKRNVYQCLIHCCHKDNFIVILVAWTGIASMLLPSGRTAHSIFKLPLNLHENSISTLLIDSKEAAYIRKSRLIIWDEAPMANKYTLKCLDRLLKDIMDNNVPFGGKIIVLGGDFRQVLPVVPRASRSAIVQNCVKFSPLWPFFKILRLTVNMRTNTDSHEFSTFLLAVGNGTYPIADSNVKSDSIDLPESIISNSHIAQEIYGGLVFNMNFNFAKVAILAPKNDKCQIINSKVQHLLPGVEKAYISVNQLITDDKAELLRFPTKLLNSIEVSGLPPHILCLKEGNAVMLMRNLSAKKGLLSGTRLIVKKMNENFYAYKSLQE